MSSYIHSGNMIYHGKVMAVGDRECQVQIDGGMKLKIKIKDIELKPGNEVTVVNSGGKFQVIDNKSIGGQYPDIGALLRIMEPNEGLILFDPKYSNHSLGVGRNSEDIYGLEEEIKRLGVTVLRLEHYRSPNGNCGMAYTSLGELGYQVKLPEKRRGVLITPIDGLVQPSSDRWSVHRFEFKPKILEYVVDHARLSTK